MAVANNCSLNVPVERLPLDQLPLEIRSNFLWPYVIINGDHSAASQVCKGFLEADGYRLLGESNKILCEAQNNSGLYSSIKKWVVDPLETRESLCQFHECIVNKIKAFGGGEIAVAHRPLTAEEVQAAHAKLQDRALEKVWPKIVSAILTVRPNLVLGSDWKAFDVRLWMMQNPEVLQQIHSLQFDEMELTMLPAEIGLFTELKELYLRENRLSELPEEVYNLVHLKDLCASGNRLRELSPEVRRLRNLKWLDLPRNQVGEFPVGIIQLAGLEQLDLAWNQLRELPTAIGQMRKLRGLFVDYNQLKKIPAEIGLLRELTRLNVSNNQLSEVPVQIAQLPHLEMLWVEDNSGLAALPVGLEGRVAVFCDGTLYKKMINFKTILPFVGLTILTVGLMYFATNRRDS